MADELWFAWREINLFDSFLWFYFVLSFVLGEGRQTMSPVATLLQPWTNDTSASEESESTSSLLRSSGQE
jgi:hypothetical protein